MDVFADGPSVGELCATGTGRVDPIIQTSRKEPATVQRQLRPYDASSTFLTRVSLGNCLGGGILGARRSQSQRSRQGQPFRVTKLTKLQRLLVINQSEVARRG